MNWKATAAMGKGPTLGINDSDDRPTRLTSKVIQQITHSNVQCFGDFLQGFQSYVFFRTLNLTNIIAIKAGLFCQFFLAQMSPSPTSADGLSDNLINIRTRHLTRKTGTVRPCYRPLAFKYRLSAGIFRLALLAKKTIRGFIHLNRRAGRVVKIAEIDW